jgi:hypothetical protein
MSIYSYGLYQDGTYYILLYAFLSNYKCRFCFTPNLPLIVFLNSYELSPYVVYIVEKLWPVGNLSLVFWIFLNYLAAYVFPDFIIFYNSWEKNDCLFSFTSKILSFLSADSLRFFLLYKVSEWNFCLPKRSISMLYSRSLTSLTILLDQEGFVFLPTVLKTREVPELL